MTAVEAVRALGRDLIDQAGAGSLSITLRNGGDVLEVSLNREVDSVSQFLISRSVIVAGVAYGRLELRAHRNGARLLSRVESVVDQLGALAHSAAAPSGGSSR